MHRSVQNLVNARYSDFMKDKVKELEGDNLEYRVLAVGMGSLVDLSSQEVSAFYNAPLDFLGEIDVLIAKMIVTAEKRLNRNVRDEYFNSIKLDMGKSEFEFLSNIINSLLD